MWASLELVAPCLSLLSLMLGVAGLDVGADVAVALATASALSAIFSVVVFSVANWNLVKDL